MSTPLRIILSIITVARNAECNLSSTLRSICEHKTDQVEFIVVEGKSTDRTLQVVELFSEYVDHLISEADSGIYDAMNKAAGLARGEFLLHINAGDTLLRIPEAELIAASDSDSAILSFPVRLSSGSVFVPRKGHLLSITNTLHHQGNFYRRALLRPYDLQYRTFSDFDLNQHLARLVKVFPHAEPVALHSQDGRSHDRRNFGEIYTIIRRNRSVAHVALAWFYFKCLGFRGRVASFLRSLR